MAGGEVPDEGSLLRLPPPSSLTVTIAIKGNSKSKDVVNWALEKFVPEGMFMFKLIHVRPVITAIPTAVGSFLLSDMRDDLVNAYRYEIECQTEKKLLPYKRMCTRKKVQVEIVQIESDDVIDAISREIDYSSVNTLVIGASSRGMFLRGRNVSSEIAESIPKFCTVYAVSKGKLSSLCPSIFQGEVVISTHDSSIYNPNSHAGTECINSGSIASCADLRFPLLPMGQFCSLSTVNQALLRKKTKSTGTLDSRFTSLEFDGDGIMTSTGTLDSRFTSLEFDGDGIMTSTGTLDSRFTSLEFDGDDIMTSTGTLDSRFTSLECDGDDIMTSCPGSSVICHPSCSLSSCQNLETDTHSWISHQASISDGRLEFSSESQISVEFELKKLRYAMAQRDAIDTSWKMSVDFALEKLRTELRHMRETYAMAQSEALDSSRKVNDLNKRLEEAIKLEAIYLKDEEAKELAVQEKVKCEAARREAEYVKECAEREAAEKNEVANKAPQEAKEKEKLENVLMGPLPPFQLPLYKTMMDVDLALERLRSELRLSQKLYPMTRIDTIDGSKEVNDLNHLRLKESIKLGEIHYEEDEAKELAIQKVAKYEAARQEAEHVKECAEREAAEKNEAANRAHKKARKKEKLENALGGQEKQENTLGGPLQQYQKFEWEDIVSATSNFSEKLKIGYGAYGTVYKCSLHHTTAAVKVLHSKEAHRNKQFQQELEVLSTIRHPHLLILLGACPNHGCLVYEYMENGSLEDVLFRKNNTPPIPWFQRYRIAWEIASALVFLHCTNPQPIIHYDLKPANILLDQNFVSKIGDVGLSKMLDFDRYSPFFSSMYIETRLMGSVDYIDPEYQRTGLFSTKSDVYAFGKVILQLVTGKVARGLTHVVETAIDEWNLAGVFDHEAGNWPVEETIELAMLGMRCAELRSKHRPSLRDEVLPALERLKEFADKARDLYNAPPGPPIYPILQNVVDYSCVAADGYTYDRRAIETWLEENDDSPNTNLPLPNFAIFDNPVFAV